jgi:hypothetical protein
MLACLIKGEFLDVESTQVAFIEISVFFELLAPSSKDHQVLKRSFAYILITL